MTRRHRAMTAAVLLAAMVSRAAADPPPPAPPPDLSHYVHLESRLHYKTDGGSEGDLPAGYFFDEPTFATIEADVKKMQDLQTNLLAQNASMRKTLAGWQPGWYLLAGAVALGLLGGWYAAKKL